MELSTFNADDYPKFRQDIIDMLENYLNERNMRLINEDRDRDDPNNPANLYGDDLRKIYEIIDIYMYNSHVAINIRPYLTEYRLKSFYESLITYTFVNKICKKTDPLFEIPNDRPKLYNEDMFERLKKILVNWDVILR